MPRSSSSSTPTSATPSSESIGSNPKTILAITESTHSDTSLAAIRDLAYDDLIIEADAIARRCLPEILQLLPSTSPSEIGSLIQKTFTATLAKLNDELQRPVTCSQPELYYILSLYKRINSARLIENFSALDCEQQIDAIFAVKEPDHFQAREEFLNQAVHRTASGEEGAFNLVVIGNKEKVSDALVRRSNSCQMLDFTSDKEALQLKLQEKFQNLSVSRSQNNSPAISHSSTASDLTKLSRNSSGFFTLPPLPTTTLISRLQSAKKVFDLLKKADPRKIAMCVLESLAGCGSLHLISGDGSHWVAKWDEAPFLINLKKELKTLPDNDTKQFIQHVDSMLRYSEYNGKKVNVNDLGKLLTKLEGHIEASSKTNIITHHQ